MMQMLRRFEENAGAEDLELEGEEEDTNDLAHRFSGIDIGPFFTLSDNWSRLPTTFTSFSAPHQNLVSPLPFRTRYIPPSHSKPRQ